MLMYYTEPDTGQVVLLLSKQVIEIKGLGHHLFCPMQWCVNVILIDEVPKFFAPIPSDTTHALQLENHFDATHPIMIP